MLAAGGKKVAGATRVGTEREARPVGMAKGVIEAEVEETKATVVLARVEARAAEVVAMARVAVVAVVAVEVGAERAIEVAGSLEGKVMVGAAEGLVPQAEGVEEMGLKVMVVAEGMMVEAIAATVECMDFGRAAGTWVVELVATQVVFVALGSGAVKMV